MTRGLLRVYDRATISAEQVYIKFTVATKSPRTGRERRDPRRL